jgi:hypothetical protein
MRQQIHDLKTKAKVFQDMKCSCCKMPLELPSVYFLCGCSYNQRCLVGLDREECIIHAEDRKKVLDVVDAQVRGALFESTDHIASCHLLTRLSSPTQADYADHHEQFFKQLDAAQNRFGVVANYFGKGVFNKITIVGAGAAAGPTPSPGPARRQQERDEPEVREIELDLGPQAALQVNVASRAVSGGGYGAAPARTGGYGSPASRRAGGYGGGGGGYGGGRGGYGS